MHMDRTHTLHRSQAKPVLYQAIRLATKHPCIIGEAPRKITHWVMQGVGRDGKNAINEWLLLYQEVVFL